jgi:hypothetical protein
MQSPLSYTVFKYNFKLLFPYNDLSHFVKYNKLQDINILIIVHIKNRIMKQKVFTKQ